MGLVEGVVVVMEVAVAVVVVAAELQDSYLWSFLSVFALLVF